jgi:hypothetical protein
MSKAHPPSFSIYLLCVSVSLWFFSPVHAQLPHIRLDRVFPLGGAAGSELLLDIAGKDCDDVKSLHFDHSGFQAELVKPNQFRLRIAAGVPPGTYEVRAVGKYGISAARLFAVSRGLTEVREVEPNDSPDKAQAVPMNCAINGTSDGNGDDFFRFAAKKGERVTIDCQAVRLDSTLRASMTLSTADGKQLLQSKPYFIRSDPFLDFIAPADGAYIVRLYDSTFSGGLPYRLVISNRPHVENGFPCAVTPGETVKLTLLGRNLPGGQPTNQHIEPGTPLESFQVSYTAPKDPLTLQRFSFINHLTSASLNARVLQAWPPGMDNALNPLTLALADAPVTLEVEPNDTPENAQAVTLPTVISGRFDKAGDVDYYSFTARRGETIAIDLLCERLDLPGDPFVIVTDAKGNELTTLDDHGININSLAQFNRDPFGSFTAPADGTYRLIVQDRYRAGGPRHAYALYLGKAVPDFYPVVFHETPNEPTCPVVRQGGSAFYEVCLNRRHFNGFVTIEAEGLPPGVTCRPVLVSPQAQHANVIFTAAPDAPEWSGAVRLKAWAMIGDQRIERAVQCSQRRWPIANINTSRVCREICLAVRPAAPYGLKTDAAPLMVMAGEAVEATIAVERHGPDFKGKVQLTGLNLPPGFGIAATELPADRNEVALKINVAANVPAGSYSVALRGDAQVPFQRDTKAAKTNVRVADPAPALTVVVKAKAAK